MKRTVCAILSALLIAGALAGCGKNADSKTAASLLKADDEILTYEKIDPAKTQLVVAQIGNNANVSNISKAFMSDNPDVQVICIDITGGDYNYSPAVDWLTHGDAPDVIYLNLNLLTDKDFIEKYFQKLSANPIAEQFKADSLYTHAVDSEIYFLPGPAEINCMLYNKTLFDRYGWEVPATFDEFVDLCVKIREDTDGKIQPWNPNAKYDNMLSVALEAFCYTELFGGASNRVWYDEFCAGNTKFAGHMEPFFDAIQKLIDNGILTEDQFNYSATARSNEFNAGQIAMINGSITLYPKNPQYEFALMPYPSTSGGKGYVNNYFSALLGVPNKTRTKAVNDALDRFIAYFGSVKGQNALIANSLMISSLIGMPVPSEGVLADIADIISDGRQFGYFDFSSQKPKGWTFRDLALKMVRGEKTGAQCIAEVDLKPFLSPDEASVSPGEKLATVAEDFTSLEFSNYIADAYRAKANSDIGLISHAAAYRGNLIRLYKGDMLSSYVTVLKPRSFANKSTLVKVSMTGRQILDAMNHPLGYSGNENAIYAFSGLKCEIAPCRDPGSKYVSVLLSDGTPLDKDKLYSVAVWDGTIDPMYVTGVLESYEGTWEDLMTDRFKSDGVLTPASDGRVKLIWD